MKLFRRGSDPTPIFLKLWSPWGIFDFWSTKRRKTKLPRNTKTCQFKLFFFFKLWSNVSITLYSTQKFLNFWGTNNPLFFIDGLPYLKIIKGDCTRCIVVKDLFYVMSSMTCHVSYVMCHISGVTSLISFWSVVSCIQFFVYI